VKAPATTSQVGGGDGGGAVLDRDLENGGSLEAEEDEGLTVVKKQLKA
jgi:hypothetical protein